MKIAVLSSGKGRGSNFRAILQAMDRGELHCEIAYVHCTKKSSGVYTQSRERSLNVSAFTRKELGIDGYFGKLYKDLDENKIDLIVLAGYMMKLPASIIERYSGRIINIHPALLPSFGGKGCYGMHVHQKVWESGVKYSGITVHLADGEYDTGPIIFQKCVELTFEDTPEDIASKVLKLEHKYYWRVIELFEQDKIKIEGSRVKILDNDLL